MVAESISNRYCECSEVTADYKVNVAESLDRLCDGLLNGLRLSHVSLHCDTGAPGRLGEFLSGLCETFEPIEDGCELLQQRRVHPAQIRSLSSDNHSVGSMAHLGAHGPDLRGGVHSGRERIGEWQPVSARLCGEGDSRDAQIAG